MPGEKSNAHLRPNSSSRCSTHQRSARFARAEATAPAQSSAIGDRLDISEAGQIASRMAEIPEIRADRVSQLRSAIQSGSYETQDKLDTALERLLDEIA